MAKRRRVVKEEKISRKKDKGYRKALVGLRDSMSKKDFEFQQTTSPHISANADRHQNFLWHSNFQTERLFLRWGGYKKFSNGVKFQQINKAFQQIRGEEIFDNMLEIGCGHGHWLYHWRGFAKDIVGLDHSYAMVESCKHKLRKFKKMRFIQGDCWQLPFDDASFDFVFMVDVTMHIGGSWNAISEMMRVAKKYVLFTGPSWQEYGWEKKTRKGEIFKFGNKKQSDLKIGRISWAVNQTLVDARLNHWIRKNRIKKYWYEHRQSSSTYNHKILMIEK